MILLYFNGVVREALTSIRSLRQEVAAQSWREAQLFREALSVVAFTICVFAPHRAAAYPGFIGYGYTTCVVCHTNSLGGGALTDYGRALFSQEIAARPWISQKMSDDDLAKLSGFLPGVELPYYIRPSIKYRGLYLDTAPGSSRSQPRWIHMQRDFTLMFAADEDHRTIGTATVSELDTNRDYYGYGQKVDFVSREHYVRFYLSDSWLVATGLMDKAYGLRTPDHTAYSRAIIGFGQEDQVHGVLVQYLKESWDAAIHLFAGNLLQRDDLRQKGMSATGEYEIGPKNRLGSSFAAYSTGTGDYQRLAIHDRWGLPEALGSSVMIELGLKNDKLKTDQNAKLGNYMLAESLTRLTRGYNWLTTFERLQDENKSTALDRQKWSFGILAFPFQRIETRLSVVETKNFAPDTASQDGWSFQGQFHVSL